MTRVDDIATDRRAMLTGIAGATAALWSGTGCARAAAAPAWPAVEAVLDGDVPAREPGAVVAIGRGAQPATFLSRGRIGMAPTAPAAGADSLWRIYSMTKPITGMCAMILIERGKLALDQNIADFIPAFAHPRVMTRPDVDLASRPASGPITVRHLLTHTAGLGYHIISKGPLRDAYLKDGIVPARVGAEAGAGPQPTSLAEFAERLATLPLIADPGSLWSYSVGLDLLGRIIELASGQPFDRFMADHILTPLGMTDTMFTVPQAKADRLVDLYGVGPGKPTVLETGARSLYLTPPPFPFGGAGLVSSARDYDRFLAMLQGQGTLGRTRIMAPATARLAMSNLLPAGIMLPKQFDGPEPSGFGAGGRVGLTGASAGVYGWGGAAGTVAWVDPRRALRCGGFVNHLPGDAIPFATELRTAVYRDVAASGGASSGRPSSGGAS